MTSFKLRVLSHALMENYINNFVVFADVLGRFGHEDVDDFAEERGIASCVSTNSGDEVGHRPFVLDIE